MKPSRFPGGAPGFPVHPIFPQICVFIPFCGAALICAVDGGARHQTENDSSPRRAEGREQKVCRCDGRRVSRRSSYCSSGGNRLLS